LTLVEREFIPAAAQAFSANAAAAIFNPSPASQMCQTMAFGYSLFFKDSYIRPDLLKKAVASLATELPPLAGRVRPPKNAPGLRSMNETVVNLNNAGIEVTIAETKCHTIQDLGPHTWLAGMNNRKLSSFGVPFYTEPFNVDNMYKGEEALLKLKLTRCIDGQILSVMVSHLLADAGRAVRLMERLSDLYRANCAGTDPGPGLHFNPILETPQGLSAALTTPPPKWEPPVEDHQLTLAQWMAAPYRMYRHTAKKFDVHMVYLPKVAVQRLKSLAIEEQRKQTRSDVNNLGEKKVSTMDAVQAFIATLVADLKRRPLVPTFPEEMTVNVDLLHKDVPYKDPEALERHIGNAVHILHVHGVEPGTGTIYK
jgi:Transferase family